LNIEKRIDGQGQILQRTMDEAEGTRNGKMRMEDRKTKERRQRTEKN
jgi:hypothetical protein